MRVNPEPSSVVRTVRGTAVLGLQLLTNAAMGTILFAYIARVLSREEMGTYGGINLVLNAAALGMVGLNLAAARFIPYLGATAQEKVAATSHRILRLSIALAAGITLTLFLASHSIAGLLFSSGSNLPILRLALALNLSSILAPVMVGFLVGHQKFLSIAVIRFVGQLGKIAVTLPLVAAGFGLAGVILGLGTYSIMVVFLAALLSLRMIRVSSGSGSNAVPLSYRELLVFAVPAAAFNAMDYLFNSIDQYVVLKFAGAESLGSYFVIVNAANFLQLLFGLSLSMTLLPTMSEGFGRGGISIVSQQLEIYGRYAALVVTPAGFLLAALSPLALLILGGPLYVDAWLPLTVAAVATIAYGLVYSFVSALGAIGRTGIILLALILGSVVQAILSVVLVGSFGLTGAAAARAAAYVCLVIILVWLGGNVMPIRINTTTLSKAVGASALMSVGTYFIAVRTGFSVLLTPAYLIVGGIIYTSAMILTRGVTRYDVNLLLAALPYGSRAFAYLSNKPLVSGIIKALLHLMAE